MNILVDTSVLIRNVKRDDPQHAAAARTLHSLVSSNATLHMAPQVVYEFWVVATRPANVNGLGWDPARARSVIADLLNICDLIADPADLVLTWLELCTRHAIRGKRAHDARLVAWMIRHGIETLLTFNTVAFSVFAEIKAQAPGAA